MIYSKVIYEEKPDIGVILDNKNGHIPTKNMHMSQPQLSEHFVTITG